ncbi:MAG: alpha-L-fucosidase [Fimbriimonadaceae bacterium]|nr:alpha-L-fucosidase [Fimbriimonadaceae bacterium]
MITATVLAALALSAQVIPRDARMEWWREAKFGLFIHWGLYAIPAGKWGDRTGHGEWIRDTAQIPLDQYNDLQGQFNPQRYDPEQWVIAAKQAGMKYIVITSKHHDGFGLFDSAATEWDVMGTPYNRDLLKPLAEACRKHEMKLGFYYSIMDWHHPDYLPRRTWETTRGEDGAEMRRYVDYMKAQLKELLTNYGDVAVIWFDGEWERTWREDWGSEIYNYCLSLQPQTIINNRVTNVRTSMEDMGTERQVGDYSTPEQTIPEAGLPGVDWETCMTMNSHWGWNAADRNWKTSRELIRNLIDIASKGGNYLLNVGPTADGEFPPESLARLKEIGSWMNANGAAIYGTQGTVIGKPAWGRCTSRRNSRETTLYLHVFDRPAGKLRLEGMGSDPVNATLLSNGRPLLWTRSDTALEFDLSSIPVDYETPVIAVSFRGMPKIYQAPQLRIPSTEFVNSVTVGVSSPEDLQVRYAIGRDPVASSEVASREIVVREAGSVRFATFDGSRRVSEVTTYEFRKVDPWVAVAAPTESGLRVREIEGDFDLCPEFSASARTFTLPTFALEWAEPKEYVAREYRGRIRVEATEMYAFSLTSDDGSRLWIDGKLVVDHDGLHSASAMEGFAPLAAGWHDVRLVWFNKTGGAALKLAIGVVGSELREVAEGQLGR